jgi:2-dehydro-3-deoxygalactonokinase
VKSPITFLSCDWGTTAFRLRAVAKDFSILAEVSSKHGIAAVFDEWKQSGKDESGRVDFYRAIIETHLKELRAKVSGDISGIPLIISGMASSNIGMMELPYKHLPVFLDGSDLQVRNIPPSDSFPHPMLLISGVRTDDDVMRGEEVQVVGCDITTTQNELFIIHPGTHCKHIIVKGDQVVSFQTFMTGELFSLLSTKSILASSVSAGADFESAKEDFLQGVRDATASNLLHAAFLVRTATLFQKRSRETSFYYLSGLLIGTELAAFPADFRGDLILAGEQHLVVQYSAAMDALGITQRLRSLQIKEPDIITLKGQYAVYGHHQNS